MSGSHFRPAGGVAAAIILAMAWAAQASAYEPPLGTVEYRINHSKYDEIGTHSLTFSRDGADVVVDVAVRIKVKLLFITAHSVAADRRETWRDGRLLAYQSRTKENKTLIEVSAKISRSNPSVNSSWYGVLRPRSTAERLTVGMTLARSPVILNAPWAPPPAGSELNTRFAPAGSSSISGMFRNSLS